SKQSTSGEQVAPKTPAGSTSPVHQERIALQENTAEDLHLTCRLDPEHPGEWRCTSIPGPVVPNADRSVSTPSADTTASKSGEGGSGIPTSDGIETWRRNNGEILRVKRVECEGRMLFEPIEAGPKSQSADPSSPPLTTVKQDLSVGRTQFSRLGRCGKCSDRLTQGRPSTPAKQNDPAGERP